VCGQEVDDCVCPPCTVCGMVGDPYCYPAHGLVRSLGQVALHAQATEFWADYDTWLDAQAAAWDAEVDR
jgi:hypothetical protein